MKRLRNKTLRYTGTNSKVADINPTLSAIKLNVNRVDMPTKKKRLADEWKKKMTQLYVVFKKYILNLDTNKLKVKKMDKDIPCKH